MRVRKSHLVLAVLVLVPGLAGESRANPVPCVTMEAARSGSEVHLTMLADRICFDLAPPSEAIITQRDLFLVELDYTLVESPEFFTFSATELDVSANGHTYEVNFVAEEGYPSMAWAVVGGPDCATLEGTLVGSEADLVLQLDRSCFATPLPALEYLVKRNWSTFMLDWTETEEVDTVRCTTTDDTAYVSFNRYEVGVRVGTATCYARLDLYSDSNPEDAGVVDAAVGADAGPPDPGDDDGGCASAGRSGGLPLLPLLVCLLFLVWRRRRL